MSLPKLLSVISRLIFTLLNFDQLKGNAIDFTDRLVCTYHELARYIILFTTFLRGKSLLDDTVWGSLETCIHSFLEDLPTYFDEIRNISAKLFVETRPSDREYMYDRLLDILSPFFGLCVIFFKASYSPGIGTVTGFIASVQSSIVNSPITHELLLQTDTDVHNFITSNLPLENYVDMGVNCPYINNW